MLSTCLDCVQLTDMSVFELSTLQKLRRIGLVRVNNLTDQAIHALGERHATLERIHLSYCDQISVMAIHFLLQKLPKLTHLSLTGITAFRRAELQQFCRPPPQVRYPHWSVEVMLILWTGLQLHPKGRFLRIFWKGRYRTSGVPC